MAGFPIKPKNSQVTRPPCPWRFVCEALRPHLSEHTIGVKHIGVGGFCE